MSFFSNLISKGIDVDNLFRPNKNEPRTNTFGENFTTSQVKIDVGERMGLVYIEAIVDNQDPTNNVTIRTDPQGRLITIPPNSIGKVVAEVHTYLEINPDSSTGTGNYSLKTADPKLLQKEGFLGLAS